MRKLWNERCNGSHGWNKHGNDMIISSKLLVEREHMGCLVWGEHPLIIGQECSDRVTGLKPPSIGFSTPQKQDPTVGWVGSHYQSTVVWEVATCRSSWSVSVLLPQPNHNLALACSLGVISPLSKVWTWPRT